MTECATCRRVIGPGAVTWAAWTCGGDFLPYCGGACLARAGAGVAGVEGGGANYRRRGANSRARELIRGGRR